MAENTISSDLFRGHIDAIILRLLADSDSYGYEIMKEVAARSGGLYELKEPSLYTSLRRLEAAKLIASYWGDESLGGRRKYYRITETGRQVCRRSLEEWKTARLVIDRLLDGGETDE